MASVQNNNRPHQIIMIPQNLLSEQSKSFLKQRLVLPSNYRPVAAVVGSKRSLPSRLTPLSPKQNPLKRPLSPAAAPIDFADLDYIKEEDSFDDEDGHHSSRKRTNLDHLSPEERLMRRKLKNRVAAQTARDKKKQYIDEMEEMLEKVKSERRLLADENRRLQTNNTNLQLENAALNKKNQELEARLGLEPSLVLPEHDSILPASPLSLPRSPSPILIDIPLSPMPPSPAAMSATSPSVGLIPTEPAAGGCQGAPGPRVVVQRLDDLVFALRAADVDVVGHDCFGAQPNAYLPTNPLIADAETTFFSQDDVQFQDGAAPVQFEYLGDIDVGEDVSAAEETLHLETTAASTAAAVGGADAGLKFQLDLQPYESGLNENILLEPEQLLPAQLEDLETMQLEDMDTPTAVKLLDDLWIDQQLGDKSWSDDAESLFPDFF